MKNKGIIKNNSTELQEESVIRKFLITVQDATKGLNNKCKNI